MCLVLEACPQGCMRGPKGFPAGNAARGPSGRGSQPGVTISKDAAPSAEAGQQGDFTEAQSGFLMEMSL